MNENLAVFFIFYTCMKLSLLHPYITDTENYLLEYKVLSGEPHWISLFQSPLFLLKAAEME